MRTHNYLLGLSLLALVACNQENMPERPTPTPGAEVKFGASLNKTDVTRTIYGKENTEKNTFPIYWVQDDKVLVTSPQCLNGRNTAQYKVSVESDKQNYATSLDKIGAVGVQWGQEPKADFYSVYPADKASVQGTTFSLTMPNVQRDILKLGSRKSKAYADMNACFMGAVSKDVPNGHDVNLTYEPLSTAIRFTLRGPSSAEGQTDSEVIISQVVLKANQPIAGDFTVDMSTPEPTVKLGSETYNEITLYTYYPETNGNLTLGLNDEVELNAFVIPYKELEVNDNWKLEVTTAQGKVYTTSLKKGSGDGKLMPGRIHRFKGQLPSLPAPTTDWDPSNWMANVPRNVYLSEISIPGSWNSLNDDYQDVNGSTEEKCKAAIDAQYKAGVRAFHIDTRWTPNRDPLVGYNFATKPTIVRLGTAVGGSSNNWDNKKFTRNDNLSFAKALEYIADHVQPKEYMMVFCTLAQKSYEETEGGWMQAVSDACAADNRIIDARTISANTVVGDVLGKVIVIVNCAKDPKTIDNLPTGSKCLFTYTPLELDENRYKTLLYCTGTIVNCADASLNMFSAQAQIMASPMNATKGYTVSGRGYAPTLEERKKKTENILKWSLDNFQKKEYAHCDWLYNGLGGYLCSSGGKEDKASYREVAKELNLWIDSKMKLMAAKPTGDQTPYYPVGLVLMNYVTNATYGVPVVKGILSHNNKFRKAYDPGKDPLDPSNNGSSSDVNSAAPGYNSGMKDNGTDAIGWTRSH